MRAEPAPLRIDERAHVFRALRPARDARVLDLSGEPSSGARWPAAGGSVHTAPRRTAYDVVVVGAHALSAGALREARALLAEGGAVVAAVHNRLGVARLAGAPLAGEDEPYAAVEGRPTGAPCFTRRELEELFAAAELPVTIHGVFPSVERARLVFADGLLGSAAEPLAWSGARFAGGATVRGASELHLWRQLVRAGVGGAFANGLLAIGAPDPRRSPWPADLLGAFFSVGVLPRYATASRVVRRPGGLAIERAPLEPGAPAAHAPAIAPEQRCEAEAPWVEGVPLVDVLEDAAGEEAWLRRWRALAEAEAATGNVDVGAHNVVVAGDALHLVDREWFSDAWSLGDVLDRNVLLLSLALAPRCPPSRWPGCATLADVAAHLAARAGVTLDLDRAVAREAVVLGALSGTPSAERETELRATLALPLEALPLGERDHALRLRADAAALSAQDAWRNAMTRGDALERRVAELEAAGAAAAPAGSTLPRR